MALKPLTLAGHRIGFPRVPFFRVFYSLTYTFLYLVTLVFLAITPISMIYASIQQAAIQYTVMIGGGYVLTAIIAAVVYSSRLYTNKSTLLAVGKSYIPIEDGEVGGMVRKMIVKQLERSAIVAWESRPRDLYGEILLAEQEGILPPESKSVTKEDYVVGTEVRVDPENSPWGDVQHPGWSSPSHRNDNKNPEVQYDNVIKELPHLIEARAVSLAPPDPNTTPVPGEPRAADPSVADLLKRPASMALREYLTQLSYLRLVDSDIGESFLARYERARFSGQPVVSRDFEDLMAVFAELLSGMTTLDDVIVEEIRVQNAQAQVMEVPVLNFPVEKKRPSVRTPSPQRSPLSGSMSLVTAREGMSSHTTTPYLQQSNDSEVSFSSVIHRTPEQLEAESPTAPGTAMYEARTASSSSLPSDPGSVVRHGLDDTFD